MSRINKQAGMSLIEIMIGMVILLTMFVYVASMAHQANSTAAQNRRKLDTIMVAQSAMEIILANIQNNSDMFPAGESSILNIQINNQYLDQGKWSISTTVYKTPNVPALLNDSFDVIVSATPLSDSTPFTLKHHITVDHNPVYSGSVGNGNANNGNNGNSGNGNNGNGNGNNSNNGNQGNGNNGNDGNNGNHFGNEGSDGNPGNHNGNGG